MPKITKIKIGEKYNGLTVVEEPYSTGKGRKVKCQCECGNIVDVGVWHLTSGNTKYCGCRLNTKDRKSNYKHGLCHSRLNNIWYKMKYRCENPNYKEYEYYGGRGIKVCDEWKNDFLSFYNWAINNGYQDGLSIDRINTNGNYSPDNCKWATAEEQGNNKRNNINITINNKTQTLARWCKELNLKYSTVLRRIRNLNWSYEEALELKERKRTYGQKEVI